MVKIFTSCLSYPACPHRKTRLAVNIAILPCLRTVLIMCVLCLYGVYPRIRSVCRKASFVSR